MNHVIRILLVVVAVFGNHHASAQDTPEVDCHALCEQIEQVQDAFVQSKLDQAQERSDDHEREAAHWSIQIMELNDELTVLCVLLNTLEFLKFEHCG